MRMDPWDEDLSLPWKKIKAVWDGYWDHQKTYLLEKSPPHLIRTQQIIQHFNPVSFIIMVRNPYAHCEGLMRRRGWSATEAAEFSVYRLQKQMENVKTLERSIYFTYEDFVDHPQTTCNKIQSFLPGLGKLDFSGRFSIHTGQNKPSIERSLTNLNAEKIMKLRSEDISQINNVLSIYQDVMAFWGYTLMNS